MHISIPATILVLAGAHLASAPAFAGSNQPKTGELDSPTETAVETVVGTTPRMGRLFRALRDGLNERQKTSFRLVEIHPENAAQHLAAGHVHALALDRSFTREEIGTMNRARKTAPSSYPLGLDAAVLCVHSTNPLETVDLALAAKVFNGQIAFWRELGVNLKGWDADSATRRCDPESEGSDDAIIQPLMLPRGSGATSVFQSRAMRPLGFRPRVETHSERNALISALSGRRLGMALASLGDCRPNRPLGLSDGKSDAVFPTRESITDRSYPLVHYVYLHTLGQPNDDLRKLIAFAISETGRKCVEASGTGILPISTATD